MMQQSEKTDLAVEELLERLKAGDDDEEAISSCVYDVVHLGARAVPVLEKWLYMPHYRARAAAAEALARLQGKHADASLWPLTADPHPVVRVAICRALATTRTDGAEDFLREAIADEDHAEVREAAVKTVGILQLHVLVPEIGKLLTDENFAVQQAVARALGIMADLRGLAAIGRALRDDASYYSHRELIEAAARMLDVRGHEEFGAAYQALPSEDASALAARAGEERSAPAIAPLYTYLEELLRSSFDRENLKKYGTLLSDEATRLRIAPALHQKTRVDGVRKLVEGSGAGSVLLLGPSGAGKTAIVHALAQELVEAGGDVLEVRGADVIRGKSYLGQWQEHALQLVDAVRRPKPVVVYVPDINEWLQVGRSSASDDSLLSTLRPYLERGDMVLIAETTPEAFRAGLGRYPAFSGLFQVVQVQPASDADTLRIASDVLEREARNLADTRQITLTWDQDLPRRALELTGHVYSGQENPGRTVSLLRQLTTDLQRRADQGEIVGHVHLLESHLHGLLERQTGISAVLLDDAVPLDVAAVRRFYEERVIGQPEAVDAVVDLITLIKAGLTNPDKPLSVLLFVGPTGVGKTELARSIAEYLFGSAERMVRIDMSEFQDAGAMERLIGSSHSETGGLLTEPVREQPFCVVLLDEIEKAHPGVYDLMLQVFDSGRLTDGRGRLTSFRRAVIVLTSNLGTEIPKGGGVGFVEKSIGAKQLDVLSAVEKHFRQELINRLDHVIPFRSLGMDAMERIARRELTRVLGRSGLVRRGVAVDLDPSVLALMLRLGFSQRYGARPLKRAIEQHLLVPIARRLVNVSGREAEPTVLRVDERDGAVRVRRVEPRPEPDKRVTVPRPFGGGRSDKLDLAGLRERALQMAAELAALVAHVAERGYRDEAARLTLALGEPGAWRQAGGARELSARLSELERLLADVDGAERRVTGLREQLAAPGLRSVARLQPLGDRLVELEEEVHLLRYKVLAGLGDDRHDAFVEVAAVGQIPPGEDPVRALATMYKGFAERHHFAWTPMFEESNPAGILVFMKAHIEGVCVYGLLRGEDGLHRLTYKGQRGRAHVHARVGVLPDRPRGGADLSPKEISREEAPLRGPRLMVPEAKLLLRVTHMPTLTSVRVLVGQDPTGSETRAMDLLAARLANRNGNATQDALVRRYTMQPTREVRDEATGIRTGRLAEVLAGHLDPFILDRLDRIEVAVAAPAVVGA